MKSELYHIATDIDTNPADICRELDIWGTYEAQYDPINGWRIAVVHQGRSYLIECREEQGEVFVYQ